MTTENQNTQSKPATQALSAPAGSEFARAIQRIQFLENPEWLNKLFDLFEKDGMPMGSDRWAEYVYSRYMELKEKERTHKNVLQAAAHLNKQTEHCGSRVYRDRRVKMTADFQNK